MKYLDENGVARLWAKIKERDNNIINNATVNAANKDGAGNTISTTYININQKGVNNGVATLGADGKVPSTQLPSYVDDVLEYNNRAAFPSTGESGKIYVAKDNNKTYRWSGSTYVEISPSIVIGTTTGTAYDGAAGLALSQKVANIEGLYVKNYVTSTTDVDIHSKIENSGNKFSITIYENVDIVRSGIKLDTDTLELDAYDDILIGKSSEKVILSGSDGVFVKHGTSNSTVLDTSMALTNAEIDAILV